MYLIFIQSEICLLAPHLMREVFFQSVNAGVKCIFMACGVDYKFLKKVEKFRFPIKRFCDFLKEDFCWML